jgi:hypothetical protein
MNPGIYRDLTSSTAGRKLMRVSWTSAASGALTNGITEKNELDPTAPVAHGSTGVYTVKLRERPVNAVLLGDEIMQASYSKSGACKVRVTGKDMAARTVTLLVVDGDGDAVDPASGDVLTLTFDVQISTT